MTLHGALTVRRLRLLSGLVMFAYIAMHLVNHALGIVSLALAEGGLRLPQAFLGTPPPTLQL
jgi:adenylate cyclase